MSREHHSSRQDQHHQGAAAGADQLVQEFSDLARSLQAAADTDRLLDEIVSAAVAMIPGVDEGSISVVLRRREVTSQSPSSQLPRLVDAVQREVGEGPCLDAVFEQQAVRVPDMATERRWPRFAERAAKIGAASMLSFQLYVERDNLGALNLYGSRPNSFNDESERVGLLFASHAAVAFAQAQKLDQMAVGLDHRDVIGQAKGILMERYSIDAVPAFALLVRTSQHSNRKLRDVAEELCRTRRLNGLR
ncbi:MAG TPA: GAF and ANTAR domain-containing protein [Propionibacteriaceae bacterium]|nr:GAF and ANTAR domain-containing protein [Propionibacteriaceae bacterium]